jgi:hypothetical protein
MLGRMRVLLLLPLVVASATSACEKKLDAVPTAPEASASAASVPAAASVSWHLAVDTGGKAHVDMAGGGQHIVGDTTTAMGSLDVVPTDLTKSRGAVMIDLASFATHTFGNGDDAKQTKEAIAWLEAVGTSDPSLRWASFAIRSVDGLSATDLTKVTPTRDGTDDVRSVTMTLHGDLLIHGHKEQRDAVVAASFRHAGGAPADAKPIRIDVVSGEPLTVTLADIDVRPRAVSTGKIAPWTAKWTASVAPSAAVTVSLSAVPSS